MGRMATTLKRYLSVFLCMVILFGITPIALAVDSSTSASEQFTAMPSTSKVFVNGKAMNFEAYNINGNNYFKLRDLAIAMNGTEKNFSVGWDSTNNAISLQSGAAYTPVGDELAASGNNKKTNAATLTRSKILIDGKEVPLTAYNIGGNNFFMLREIGERLNFSVNWRSYDNTIQIITYPDVSVNTINGNTNARTTVDYYYYNWFKPSQRYLFKNGDQINLLDIAEQTIHIQQFTSSFSKIGEKIVNMELPLFGGFHQGEDGNYYVIYGQKNDEESNTKAVYRVIKYDSSWSKMLRWISMTFLYQNHLMPAI